MSDDDKKIKNLLRHIKNVQDNCLIIGEKLISKGEVSLGRQLIANSMVHDNSKFYGIEFDYLTCCDDDEEKDREILKIAISQHNTNPNNKHHPESWAGGIKEMSRVYIAEMVADCAARSSEFGKDVREWFKNTATDKYGFNTQSKVYLQIKEFLDMLLDKPF